MIYNLFVYVQTRLCMCEWVFTPSDAAVAHYAWARSTFSHCSPHHAHYWSHLLGLQKIVTPFDLWIIPMSKIKVTWQIFYLSFTFACPEDVSAVAAWLSWCLIALSSCKHTHTNVGMRVVFVLSVWWGGILLVYVLYSRTWESSKEKSN